MSQDHLLIIITVELSEIDPSMNNSDRNPAAASRTSDIEVVIRPATGLRLGSLLEIWRYRGLIASMSNRQMRMRFSDMWLGLFWILARPITMTLVFVFIRNLSEARMGGGIPYPAFVFSGLVLWFYMAGTIGEVANALQRDAGLVQKVYFPRLVSPTVPVFANLIELALGAVILAALMPFLGLAPGWQIVLLPIVLLQILLLVYGIGIVFATLNIVSKDWDQFLGLVLYIGLFMSPVIYAAERLPPAAKAVYFVNPFAGTLMALRSCLFEPVPFPVMEFAYSLVVALVAVVVGVAMFRRAESQLLDSL